MEKQSILLICQPSFQPAFALTRFTEQLASFFTLWSWSLALRIRSGGGGRHPEGILIKNEDVWWLGGMHKRGWGKCALVLSGCAAFYLGNEGKKKIFPWSATPCDIPTHTLLLTFYLPLNSPAVVTFSGFLNYVLQDLKSEGRDFKKITSVDRHLYISRSCYTLMLLEVKGHSFPLLPKYVQK